MSDDRWYGYDLDEHGFIMRPGDDPLGCADVVEAQPTSDRLYVRLGWYGPRGGFHCIASGSLGEMRYLRGRLDDAIEFGEQVEEKRQQWLADRKDNE